MASTRLSGKPLYTAVITALAKEVVFFFFTVDNRTGEGGWESMVICIISMLICIKYLLTLIILSNNLTLAVCDDEGIDIDLD